jgi:hypothetical protein
MRMIMLLHVDTVTLLGDFALRLGFSDGSVRDVDLSEELHGDIFEPLRKPEFFAKVRVNPETGTIEWPNGADLAPEFLHELGKDSAQLA